MDTKGDGHPDEQEERDFEEVSYLREGISIREDQVVLVYAYLVKERSYEWTTWIASGIEGEQIDL